MKKHEINKDLVNWTEVMSASRCAGGHVEVMESIFEGKAKVCASWIEGDYQGDEAFAYLFPDGTVAIMTDSFGSCSGCDSWEDANDDDVRLMVESLVNSARVFHDVAEAYFFCLKNTDDADQYLMRSASNLVKEGLEHEFKVWLIAGGQLDDFISKYGWAELEKIADEHDDVAKLLADPDIMQKRKEDHASRMERDQE